MNIAAWRDVPALQLAGVLSAERERWRRDLNWDYSATLAEVERARVSGTLPGVVATDDGRIAGWAYYLWHRNTLLIGHVSARNEDVTRRLLGAVLSSVEAQAASSVIAFGYFDAPGLDAAFKLPGFVVEPYLYLSREFTTPMDPPRRDCGPYDLEANRAVARVLQGAYLTSPPNRPFALGGTDAEWIEYVTQLTHGNGCGQFDLKSSVLRDGGCAIDGAAIVSAIAEDTAHLCQLAVNPGARRIGLGVDLLSTACARAKQNGRVRMTLTVASSNTAALGLYRRLGFAETARFTFARR